MKVKWQNGFPLPKRWLNNTTWVNGTPHFSSSAAEEHRFIMQQADEMGYFGILDALQDWLLRNIDQKLHTWIRYCSDLAKQGRPEDLFSMATDPLNYTEASSSDSAFLVRQLLEDETESVRDATVAGAFKPNVRHMAGWLSAQIESGTTPLLNYEKKMFLKYLSDATRRTGDEYVRSVTENYLPDRSDFADMRSPELKPYEDALLLLYGGDQGGLLRLPKPSVNGVTEFQNIGDFIASARRTTYGGAPFFKNMGTFVSEDLDDPTTYADYYNKCAVAYLFLPPEFKLKVLLDFVALERIQQGGVSDELSDLDPDNLKVKANKQRVVQAMSAVLSHANKFLVDLSTRWNRLNIPEVAADKIGESNVTEVMKRAVYKCVGTTVLSPETVSPRLSLVGADYTNFDASQNIILMNDAHYQIWRRLTPFWVTSWIIDPYIKLTYSRLSITFPVVGNVVTTGVKSGQVDTNDADTHLAMFSDMYERTMFEKTVARRDPFSAESQNDFSIMMDNGDDRFKTSLLTAEQINEFDSHLGFIAQASKQEVWPAGTPLSKLGVTYLKTILCYQDGRLIRTDSILKVILGRFNRERPSKEVRPYSLILETVMSAMRAYESPYLYVLVDWMAQFDIGRAWLLGKMSSAELIAGSSLEGLSELKATKGKLWLAKMKHLYGMDVEYVVQQTASRFGLTPDGHRASEKYFADGKLKLDSMEVVDSLRRSAAVREKFGILGKTFNDSLPS